MDIVRHRLLVLDAPESASRQWAVDEVGTGPHPDHLLLCGCCEAPLVYGWLPDELTAIVRCECGCCCAASETGASQLPGHRLSREYVATD